MTILQRRMTHSKSVSKTRKTTEKGQRPGCFHCNTPGHGETNCYFGANMEIFPPEWARIEAQQTLIEEYKQNNNPINTRNRKSSTSNDL